MIKRVQLLYTEKPHTHNPGKIAKQRMLESHYDMWPDHYYILYDGKIKYGKSVGTGATQEEKETIRVCICGCAAKQTAGHKAAWEKLLAELTERHGTLDLHYGVHDKC